MGAPFLLDSLPNLKFLFFIPISSINFISSDVEHYQVPFDNQSMLGLNPFFSSYNSQIYFLILINDPCILYFKSDILFFFGLLVINYVLPV